MNASVKIGIPGLLLLAMLSNRISAQDTIVIKSLPTVTVTAATMHVPKKVWKSFAGYFTGAYNSRFFIINKEYLAKFILNNQENRALFTKQGSLVYNISYGYEKSLPEDIRKQIKSSYYDYEITRAIKVTEGQRLIWVVNLETNKKLLIVRMEDGDIDEVQQLDKL